MTETKNHDITRAVANKISYADRKNFLFRVHDASNGKYDGFSTRWEAKQHAKKLIKNSQVVPLVYKHNSTTQNYELDTTCHAQIEKESVPAVKSGINNDVAIQHFKELSALAGEIAKTLHSKDQSGLEGLKMDLEAKYKQAMSIFAAPAETENVKAVPEPNIKTAAAQSVPPQTAHKPAEVAKK